MLVPETATRLIAEDLALPRPEAIATLRESVTYGVGMFPADDGDRDGLPDASLGATEQMLMERAKARRKELELEERLEAEAAAAEADVETAPKLKPKPKPRPRARGPGAQTDTESTTEHASSPPPPSTVKRKASRAPSARAAGRSLGPPPGSMVIELSSDTGDSDAASPPKRQRKARCAPTSRAATSNGRDNVDVDMDETRPSADATPKAATRARVLPRPRAKKPCSGSVPDTDGARSDTDAAPPPPSSSQSTPCVSWDRKGDATVRSSNTSSEATPRAKPKSRSGSAPSDVEETRLASSSSKKAPLQLARERRQLGKKT